MTTPDLSDILADPASDDPRRAYADAIEEDEPDRAELIRVQLEMADPAFEELSTMDRLEKMRRVDDLLSDHDGEWNNGVAELVDDYDFRRGFVGWIKISVPDFVEKADDIFERAPIEEIEWTGLETEALDKALAHPKLEQVRSLTIKRDVVSNDHFRRIAKAPGMQNLRELEVPDRGVSESSLTWLAANDYLPNLERLGLRLNPVDPEEDEEMHGGRAVYKTPSPELVDDLEDQYGPLPWLSA